MTRLRRLSLEQASELATEVARELLESTESKNWDRELFDARPDVVLTEKDGKIPRFWSALVQYSRNGAVLDGPASILVDLKTRSATWR